ncbi:HAMP domain-containing sensor histidine kinase [Streptomyces sp. PTY087I2]|uniref:HAMP domain-containing sensor histidine kinase n=1 Tax=Streptomyces sp. PTY087I2 TaxID=1819298 RepID=UPI00080BA80A|nr:HAMP domain-containing sensor histidine kinase [Streptomyces sp. PTY087I2]OCC11587.1 Sensor protein CpxA [Streptomyces sp. PTY087I2]
MRWALIKVCLAVTGMVVLAFAVPLALVVKEMASDRAFSQAERQANALGPTLSITTDREQLLQAVLSTEAGAAGRMAVHLPASKGGGGEAEMGRVRADHEAVEIARELKHAGVTAVPGGSAFLQPFALGSGKICIVEVFVPEAEVGRGVAFAWLVLAGVGIALVTGSVLVADRLGIRMTRPAERLAGAAQQLGRGSLEVRVPEEGPGELRRAAQAFNAMAGQVVELLANERELAADLSHRLRTPLTVLRLNAASLGEGTAAEQTRAAVAHLEREVDTIIRAARDAKPRTAGQPPAAGCDASEVIRERMNFWAALAEDEDRAISVAGAGAPVFVPVQRTDMAAALDALLGNVFQHTPEGTAFSLDMHRSQDAVIILVSDAGPGIADPEAALARGNDGGRDGSTGLGLDIVRQMAEATGGDVRIGRSMYGGAEIRVWIQLNALPGEQPRRRDRRTPRRRGRPGVTSG